MLVRIIENVIVCAIIPQSSFMCKAIGHCSIEPTIAEIGDSTLIHNISRGQGHSTFENLIYDRLAANMILLSIVITSALNLLGQLLVVDRCSLSLEAYNFIQQAQASDSLLKRGGKKFNSNNNESYKFLNESPSIDSNKNLLRRIRLVVYKCFSLEFGALSTSNMLSYIFYAYTVHALIIVLLAILYSSTGRDWYPLVLTLIAIFTAAGGSDVDTADFDEVDEIAREINSIHLS